MCRTATNPVRLLVLRCQLAIAGDIWRDPTKTYAVPCRGLRSSYDMPNGEYLTSRRWALPTEFARADQHSTCRR